MGSYKGCLIANTPHQKETNETATKVPLWTAGNNYRGAKTGFSGTKPSPSSSAADRRLFGLQKIVYVHVFSFSNHVNDFIMQFPKLIPIRG